MRIACIVALGLSLVPAVAAARKPKPTPCTGTYVVSGEPLVGTAAPDAVVIGSTIASASGCPAAKVKLKAKKKGTRVTGRWTSCPGLTGKAVFSGTITPDCATLTGVLRAKKSKLRRSLTATRSTCGDGFLDAAVEVCDGPSGCDVGELCGETCACSGGGPTCGPNAPAVQIATGGTPTAGQPVTFDAGATTDADGDPLVFSWAFGDGGRGGGAEVAHVFTTAGQKTVRLTVSDGCEHVTTLDRVVAIAAGPTPTGTTTAQGRVLELSGAPIAGAEVRAEPGGTATSNGAGDVTVTVGQGVPVRITVAKDGYAEQVILTQVPNLPQPDAYFEATLVPREAAETLDATSGGTITGSDGAHVALPAGALVDGDGDPVGGEVDVFVTPVNIVDRIRAFPGRAVGLSTDGTQGPIVTYGTVEYAFAQNGEKLNLEPGTLATIEIPIYAAKNRDGSAVIVGQSHPLWAFDPATGAWVEEGQGTVVASATSPTGLALRGQVTHFSWWNCDDPSPPYFPKPKCLVDTNADGVLEDLTGTGHCWHAGTGPEQPDDGFFTAAVEAPAFPNWLGQEVLPASGGTILPMPADMDIVLHSRALGGLLQGSTMLRGPALLEEDVIVVLKPVDVTGTHITIPFETERELSDEDSLHVYDFDGTAGQTVFVTVDEPGTSVTQADVTIVLPDDSELGPVTYRPFSNDPGLIGLVLPSTGNYRIVINLAPSAFDGNYHILVDYTADFPIVLSTTPASDGTGVATSITPAVTFSRTVGTALRFDLFGAADAMNGTTSVAGDVVTFTPDAPLVPGAAYRAEMSGFRTPGEVSPNGFPRRHVWTFNVAEAAGTVVPVGPGNVQHHAIAAAPDGTMHAVWQRRVTSSSSHETVAAEYTPGVGWSLPTTFFDGAKLGSGTGADVAVTPDGAIAVWSDPTITNVSSIYESRYTPETGWSFPELIESVDIQFSRMDGVGADAAGNVIATFGTTAPAGQGDLYWTRFTAGGAWTAPAILIDDVRRPALAVGPTGHAVAAAQALATSELLVRRYTPGQGWSAVETFETIETVSLAVDGTGNLFVLAVTDNIQHVVRRFDQTAQTWSAPLNVQGTATCPFDARIVAAPGGSAFVAGCTAVSPGPGLFAVRYTPADGWGTSVLLAAAGLVDIGVDAAGNAVAAWVTADGAGHYRRFTVASGWEASAHDVAGVTPVADRRLGVGGNGVAVLLYVSGITTAPLSGVRLP